MGLEEKLSEEDKARILNEVERERRKELIYQLFEEGTADFQSVETRTDTFSNLEFLAKNKPSLYVKLYQKGIQSEDEIVRGATAGTLGSLAVVDPHKFEELYQKGIESEDEIVRRATAGTLGSLAAVDPHKFEELYQKGIKSEDTWVGRATAGTLGSLAAVDPHKFEELYQKGIESEDGIVRWVTARTLGSLAAVDPHKFEELYQKGIESVNKIVRENIARTLGSLAKVNLPKFEELYEKGIQSEDTEVRKATARTLGSLAAVDPHKFEELYQKVIEMEDLTMHEIITSLEIINVFKRDNQLSHLISTLGQKVLEPIRDVGYAFFEACLNSKYIGNKTSEELITELQELVRSHPNYQSMQTILELGEAKNLSEISECANIKSPTYLAVCKLGSGASGTTYKAYSIELKQYRALKVIPPKVNPKEAELMARLGRRDLDNIVQIHDAGMDLVKVNGQRQYAINMEYVNGETLDNLLKKGKMPVENVLSYSAQIFNGLKSLRSQGIVHRDLNLKNIKVKGNGIVKILDFGIATDEKNPAAINARSFGPPREMGANDLFSFGLIVYQMATGEHLVLEKGTEMSSNSRANEIDKLKQKMYVNLEKGILKDEYREKIDQNLPYTGKDDSSCLPHSIVICSLVHWSDFDRTMNRYKYSPYGDYLKSREDLVVEVKELRKHVVKFKK